MFHQCIFQLLNFNAFIIFLGKCVVTDRLEVNEINCDEKNVQKVSVIKV